MVSVSEQYPMAEHTIHPGGITEFGMIRPMAAADSLNES
jgi:hypothetical protein